MQRPYCSLTRLGGPLFLAGLLMQAVPAHGQSLIPTSAPNSHVNIFNTDLAVLEAGEVRKDLPCSVTPSKPTIGFDLRFHAGYEVTIPLKEMVARQNLLNIIFRAETQYHRDQPLYFIERARVTYIEVAAKGGPHFM